MPDEKNKDPQPLDPKEAVRLIEEQRGGGQVNPLDLDNGQKSREDRENELLGSTSQAIALRKVAVSGQIKLEKNRQRLEIARIKALDQAERAKIAAMASGRESAKRHIAVYGGLYCLLIVGGFIWAAINLQAEVLSVVSAVVSILVVNLTAILMHTIKEDEHIPADPAEMMAKLLDKTIPDPPSKHERPPQ